MRVSDMYFSRLSKYFPRGKLLLGLGVMGVRVIGLPPLVYDHSRPTLECYSTEPTAQGSI